MEQKRIVVLPMRICSPPPAAQMTALNKNADPEIRRDFHSQSSGQNESLAVELNLR